MGMLHTAGVVVSMTYTALGDLLHFTYPSLRLNLTRLTFMCTIFRQSGHRGQTCTVYIDERRAVKDGSLHCRNDSINIQLAIIRSSVAIAVAIAIAMLMLFHPSIIPS